MTTLRDMPMITIEQKNRFREAALKVEAELVQVETSNHNIGRQMGEVQEALAQALEERDELAAHVEEVRVAHRSEIEGIHGHEERSARLLAVGRALNQSPIASLARRDARMKAEALEDMANAYEDHHEILDHLRDAAEAYRKQAEGEA